MFYGYFASLLYLEALYKISIYGSFKPFIGMFFYCGFIAVFVAGIHNAISKKSQNIYAIIVFALTSFIYGASIILRRYYDLTFSFEAFKLADQIVDPMFIGQFFSVLLNNLSVILLVSMPSMINFLFIYKWNKKGNKFSFVLALIFVALFFFSVYIDPIALELYFKKNNPKEDVNKFGVMPSLVIETRKYLTAFSEEIVIEEIPEEKDVEEPIEEIEEVVVYQKQIIDIDFDKLIENDTDAQLKSMDQFFKNDTPTYKNEYTGLFEGKNLIYIMAESFDGYMVSEELTPTLYKMIHSGFDFENYYTPTNLSTIGGEFALLTGLYQNIGELSGNWRKGKNEYPLGLANVFKNIGYSAYAYHDGKHYYQNRDVYLKSIGFDNYYGCNGGLEKKGMACRVFPESDDLMFKSTINDYVNDEKFIVYYATISGHMHWDFNSNVMSIKHKDEVANLDKNTIVKAYIAACMELEHGLTSLLNMLEEAGRLDDTVIVLAADHHPYGFMDYNGVSELELMSNLAGKQLDEHFEMYRNNLIIYNSQMEHVPVSKVCNTIDVLPTVYNLFGIQYDSRLFTGKDIMSNSQGIALFASGDWISDAGKFLASTNKFEMNEDVYIPDIENYVEQINKIVDNRKLMAKYIMSNNYYKHVIN